jgi:hypothetical protein
MGIDSMMPSAMRTPVPDSRSSGREYPAKPSAAASANMAVPISQLTSRGLRNAPVKKMRSTWIPIAATNRSAAQWWIWRISRPARTSKLMFSVEAYASLILTPSSLT